MTALTLHQLLQNQILGQTGKTFFQLGGLRTQVSDRSVVGNIIQEWLKEFMITNKIWFGLRSNTQQFPDFFMDPNSQQKGLLEVKCFTNSPNFDVANVSAYCRSLLTDAYRLDADYLIFKYSTNSSGDVTIDDIWLKNVWEICSPSRRTSIKRQIKQGQHINIRPATFYSPSAKFKPFKTRLDFVKALEAEVNSSQALHHIQNGWIKKVQTSYKNSTGNNL